MTHTEQRQRIDRVVLIGSIVTSVYFLLLYLNYAVFKSDFVLIGVFQELLTIPCMLIQPVLLVMSIRSIYLGPAGNKYYPVVSAIVLGISIALTWGSWFIG